MLTLDWSDSSPFMPVDFALLSFTKKQIVIVKWTRLLIKGLLGTNAVKFTIETYIAVQLIQNFLSKGMVADYVLTAT